MDIEYDRDVDAVYVGLSDAPYVFTRCVDGTRNLDYGADGRLLGLEFFCASRGVTINDLLLAEKGINPVEVARHLIEVGVTVLDTVTYLQPQI